MKLFCLLFLSTFLISQTDIVLYELMIDKNGIYSLNNPKNISNRSGYDNQPKFGSTGSNLYYSSNRDGKQSDIYRYHIPSKKEYNISNTPTKSEYSPHPTPVLNEISAVKVTNDLQNLWVYQVDDNTSNPLKAAFFDKIGYYAWINNQSIAAFVLPAPFSLYWFDFKKQLYTKITDNIGRSLNLNPKTRRLNFLKKKDETQYEIIELIWKNDNSFDTHKLIDGLDNSQDFAVSSEGNLIMATGSELYMNKYGTSNWIKFHDVEKDKFGKVTRLDINNKNTHIAIAVDIR